MFSSKYSYSKRISSSDSSDRGDDTEGLLEKEDGSFIRRKPATSRLRAVLIGIATHSLVFLVALGLGSQILSPFAQTSLNKFQHWSSVQNDVKITFTPTRFNGSFMHANIYRQDAGPEVDAAWEALGVDYRPLAIPDEDAERSGISKSHTRINPKYGGGYPANVEGLHHLHCLNLLRKSLAWNFDHYSKMGKGAFSNEEHIVKLHVTHCLDILRQQLMCTVDTGALGQIWWGNEKEYNGFVDFNTVHMCRNYEDIRKWAEVRQLPPADTTPEDFLLPPRSAADILPDIP